MKAAPHIDYKALYEQGLLQIKQQEKLIALCKDNVTKCVQEQQRLGQVVIMMQKTLIKKEALIEAGQKVIASHQQTIHSQTAMISQREQIITSQNTLIVDQQKELLQNKKDLSRLDMVKHELKLLKKMIHGRRSEKHYPTANTTEQNALAGEQLSLNMEVDQLAIRCIKNTKLIPEHMRVTTETVEKKRHPHHEFPEGLPEQIIDLYPADIPAGAVLVRHEDTKQLACTDMKFHVMIYRRYIYIAPIADEGTFKQLIAPLPSHPIAKCMADISILVKLIIDKFIYHLPTWRQQQRFKQFGIALKYNTLSHWINRIAGCAGTPVYRFTKGTYHQRIPDDGRDHLPGTG